MATAGMSTVDSARELGRRDVVGFLALFGWPFYAGIMLILDGLTRPPGGIFGIFRDTDGLGGPTSLVFLTAGVAYLLAAFTVNAAVRTIALGLGSFATLGRALTLILVGTEELPRARELGFASIMGIAFAGLVLMHFLTIPNAAKIAVDLDTERHAHPPIDG
jgi:hypothetical protein